MGGEAWAHRHASPQDHDARRWWPADADTLVREQERLADLAPEPWIPPERPLLVGAAFVAFVRGEQGPGHPGDHAWVGAVLWEESARPAPGAGLAASAGTGAGVDPATNVGPAASVGPASSVDPAASVNPAGSAGPAPGAGPRARVLAEVVVPGIAGASYAPGLLALREGPMLDAALTALPRRPDVLLVDATGRDHPRRAGLALHLGAVLDVPSVGVTHRSLRASGADAGPRPGDEAPLLLGGAEVARWVRTAAGVRTVVAHAAWRTDPSIAAEVALRCARGFRTPEPLRQARRVAREARAARGLG